jgi:hypothetical protein
MEVSRAVDDGLCSAGRVTVAEMERLLQCLPGLLAVAFTEDGVWVVEDGPGEREGSVADGEVRFAVVFEGLAAPRDECEGGYVVHLRAEEGDESIGGVGEPGVLHVEEGRASRGEPESSGEAGEIGLVRGGDESEPLFCGRERLKPGSHGTRDACDFPNAWGGELFEEFVCVRKARLVGKRGGHGVR